MRGTTGSHTRSPPSTLPLIDVLVEYAGKLPSAETELAFVQLGGAGGINRVPSDATAYRKADVASIDLSHTVARSC